MSGINVIRRWVIQSRLKEQGKQGGVMITLPPKNFVDLNTSITADRLLRSGIDIDQLTSVAQVENLVNRINKLSTRVISQDDPRFKGIMDKMMGKRGEVVDMEGKKIPPGSRIMGGKEVKGTSDRDRVRNEMKEKYGFTDEKLNEIENTTIDEEMADRLIAETDIPPGSRGGADDIAAPVQSAEESLKNMIQAENKKNIATMKQRKMLDEAIEDASPGFANDIKVDADLVAENLAERMGLVYDDLPTKQRLDLYDQAYTGLSKQRFKGMKKPDDDPEKMADGGRIGLKGGADAATESFSKSAGSSRKGRADPVGGFNLSGGQGPTFGGAPPTTGGGGGGDGPKGPPSVINPPPKTKVKKNISTGSFTPTFNFLKKFMMHDNFVDQLKARRGKNYHELGGLDFMARFPNINPEVAKMLASGYQNVFELGRAVADGPGGKTIGDALDTAEEEARLNAVGIDAFSDPTSSLYQTYADMVPESGAVQMAQGGIARIGLKEGLTPEQQGPMGPVFTTSNPKEAAKEVVKRLIKIEDADIPISDKLRISLQGLDKATVQGVIKILGGELSFGAGKQGSDKGIGINFYKSFEKGGIARIGLKDGMNRRTFLKLLGGAVSIPIIGRFFKPVKGVGKVSKTPMIKTPDIKGKPEWFDSLVNRVIMEGDDVTKKLATKDREVVHTKKLNDTDEVTIYQDLETDSIRVEYKSPDNMLEEPVDLMYKRTPPDESVPKGSAEFEASEMGFVSRQDGPDDYFIDAEPTGGSTIKDLDSDVSALKEYATGKGPTMKEFVQKKKRKDKVKKLNEGDLEAQSEYVIDRQGDAYDFDNYASGGIARMLGE